MRRDAVLAIPADGTLVRDVPGRRALRCTLGAAAVLSEAEAVVLLPCRDERDRAWLRKSGLVRDTPLGRLVVWGDVVAALRCETDAFATTPAPVEVRIPRSDIRQRP